MPSYGLGGGSSTQRNPALAGLYSGYGRNNGNAGGLGGGGFNPLGGNGQSFQPPGPNPAQPFLTNTGVARPTNQPQPTGQVDGRPIYGWQTVNGVYQPVYNPTQNYVEQNPNAGNFNPNPGGGGGGGGQPPPNMGGQIGPLPPIDRIPEIPRIDDSEAVREAYARAKDVAGNQGRAALDALMDIQGGRGIVGSGLGVNEAGGIISEGARQLGDFNREQAIQRVENERWRQGTNYQGNINQRGQDYGGRGQELERRRWNAGRLPYGQIAY